MSLPAAIRRELKARLGDGVRIARVAWSEMQGLYYVDVIGPDRRKVVHSFPPTAGIEETVLAILDKLDAGRLEYGVRDGEDAA